MGIVELNAAAAATNERGRQIRPRSDWRRIAAHLRRLDQRVGMSADIPEAASGRHVRVVLSLDDAATGEVVTLPPALHHSMRPGPSDRACIELLVPATAKGLAAVRGLRLAWSGRRAGDVAPLWDCMCVEVHGRGTIEAAAGVLSAWASVFPDAVTRVGEAGGAELEEGGVSLEAAV